MASVNLTCTECETGKPCTSCRAIARSLQAAGHFVTQTPRYQALKAAMLGSYGFDACILPLARHEEAVVDAAALVLAKTNVAVIVEPGPAAEAAARKEFTVIPAADWQSHPFPTEWIARRSMRAIAADAQDSQTTTVQMAPLLPPQRLASARQRLQTLAVRAQKELGSAGFGDERLDSVALLEDEIAWANASSGGFGLVLIILPVKSSSGPLRTEQALAALREVVRQVVRANDPIGQGSDSLLVVLPEVDETQALLVAQRVGNRLRRASKNAKTAKAPQVLQRAIVGTAAYPAHGLTHEMLLARATASAKPLST
jgi:GGDEF domain-containing protein